jgi:hypothetical protein
MKIKSTLKKNIVVNTTLYYGHVGGLVVIILDLDDEGQRGMCS